MNGYIKLMEAKRELFQCNYLCSIINLLSHDYFELNKRLKDFAQINSLSYLDLNKELLVAVKKNIVVVKVYWSNATKLILDFAFNGLMALNPLFLFHALERSRY